MCNHALAIGKYGESTLFIDWQINVHCTLFHRHTHVEVLLAPYSRNVHSSPSKVGDASITLCNISNPLCVFRCVDFGLNVFERYCVLVRRSAWKSIRTSIAVSIFFFYWNPNVCALEALSSPSNVGYRLQIATCNTYEHRLTRLHSIPNFQCEIVLSIPLQTVPWIFVFCYIWYNANKRIWILKYRIVRVCTAQWINLFSWSNFVIGILNHFLELYANKKLWIFSERYFYRKTKTWNAS